MSLSLPAVESKTRTKNLWTLVGTVNEADVWKYPVESAEKAGEEDPILWQRDVEPPQTWMKKPSLGGNAPLTAT